MVVKLPKASILTNAKVSPSLFLSTSQSQLYFYKLLVPGTKNNSFTLLTLQQGGAGGFPRLKPSLWRQRQHPKPRP